MVQCHTLSVYFLLKSVSAQNIWATQNKLDTQIFKMVASGDSTSVIFYFLTFDLLAWTTGMLGHNALLKLLGNIFARLFTEPLSPARYSTWLSSWTCSRPDNICNAYRKGDKKSTCRFSMHFVSVSTLHPLSLFLPRSQHNQSLPQPNTSKYRSLQPTSPPIPNPHPGVYSRFSKDEGMVFKALA